jgi:YhcG PDDEXK nuclease domain
VKTGAGLSDAYWWQAAKPNDGSRRDSAGAPAELKRNESTPEAIAKLNFYVAVVNDTLRQPHHAPTVGLLLCTSKSDRALRYSLNNSASPMAVASYRYTELPAIDQAGLPREQELLDLVDDATEVTDMPATDPL